MDKRLIAGLSFLAGAAVGGTGVYIWARKWINERVNQEMKEFREDMRDGLNIAKSPYDVSDSITKEMFKDSKHIVEVKGPHCDGGDVKVIEKDGEFIPFTDGKKIFKSQVSRDYSSYFSAPTPDEIAKAARTSFNEHMAEREIPEDDDEEEIDPDSIDETEDERQIREEGLVNIEENRLADYDPLEGIIRQTSERTYLINEGSYGEVFSPESLVWCMKDGKLVDRADNSYYGDPYRIIGELPAGKFEDGDCIYIRNTILQFDYEVMFRNVDFDGYIDSLNPLGRL